MDMPTNTMEERKKPSVELINIETLFFLSDYHQRKVLAEKINELIKKINLDKEQIVD